MSNGNAKIEVKMSLERTFLAERFTKSLPDLSSTRDSQTSDFSEKKLFSISLSQLQNYKDEYLKFEYRPTPFNLRWAYGYNHRVPVINLYQKLRTQIFYAASNCGVIYDWKANEMKLLQGHRNTVTSIASDAEGRWLATADSGHDNIVTIWDSDDGFPKRTIFHPHGNTKLAKVALSSNAKYLLTLAYKEKANLNWWIWSFGQDAPHATIDIDEPKDAIIAMSFNPVDTEQFFLLTKRELWIGACTPVKASDFQNENTKYELKVWKPTLKGCGDYGKLTSYTYIAASSQVLVANTRGAVMIFGYSINFLTNVDASNIYNLRFVKMLKLETNKINAIETMDDVVVTGNDRGELKFYDLQLRVLYWCQGFRVNSIRGISFNMSPRNYILIDAATFPKGCQKCPCTENKLLMFDYEERDFIQQFLTTKVPTDATKQPKPFMIRDFLICTKNEGIGMVNLAETKYTPILAHRSIYATALSVHCEKPLLCIGYSDGQIELINYVRHKAIMTRDIREHFKVVEPAKPDSIRSGQEVFMPSVHVSCLKYSPSGLHLACGLDNGELLFLDPTTIDIKKNKSLTDTSDAIQKICYSPDSLTLAFADAGRKVCVYVYDCKTQEWQFLAKHKAHYKPITHILFTNVTNADGYYKLISFGEDRIMVEYDIGMSSDEYLEILSLDRVEQSAVPYAAVEWPAPEGVHSDIPALLIANSQFKYKVINYSTAMTLGTFLGPRFETPVKKLHLIKKQGNGDHYLLFSTKNVIGIQMLPLDGNPYKHVALLGHPNEITEMCFRDDSGILFTIGARDSCISQWAVKYRSVETTTKSGGTELDPYYCLMENGREGWLFREMRDLFYYVQILCQGTFSPAMRRVGDVIPINSLPDLMRALGFFPSEYEVENLLTEAKYMIYNKEPASNIGFDDFVKLYLNHRPAFGEHLDRLKQSFGTFTTYEKDGDPAITSSDFVQVLSNYGECFSNELSSYLLKVLVGINNEDESVPILPAREEFNFLPDDITFNEFAMNILGMPETEDIPDLSASVESTPASKQSSTISQD